ncbi:glutaredoxin family protein [Aidingimonas lacisalsi]|uniref:glutaredoxin family protein n=1 Tax=Aidingimonas lacisalsi TaxID=2604086 RepID=UPI0011D2129F|nr:glutaredoxin family protein [Aidingimonas lacisalsi]
MIRLTLYTTLGCHLCEQLEAQVVRLGSDEVGLARVEIADDETLLARYGERIPVLVDAAGYEFDGARSPEHLADWLAERGCLRDAAAITDASHASSMGYWRDGRRYLG